MARRLMIGSLTARRNGLDKVVEKDGSALLPPVPAIAET
jgi:hypothetical protein